VARVELAPRAVERLTDEMSAQYLKVYAPLILILLQFQTPIDTGRLRASATFDNQLYNLNSGSRVIRFRFPARSPEGVEYAQILFAGRREVRPVNAQALRWVTKGRGAVVFSQRSKAVPPNRWTLRVFQQIGFRNVRVERR
jgi:hypothetical protein